MDHIIINDIITDKEQNDILEYVNSQKNNMGTYAKFGPQPNHFIPVSFIDLNTDNSYPKLIDDIIKKVQDLFFLPYVNPHTGYGWAISYGYKGSGVLPHKDPFNKINKDDISFRMNILIQNSDSGGDFVFHYGDKQNVIKVPNKSLMIFPASEIEHSISKNNSNKPRINLSIDAIVPSSFWHKIINQIN